MKNSLRQKVLVLGMTFVLVSAFAQAAEYYVVIGAFSTESNARRYSGTVRNFFSEVSYSLNENSNLYYVHVLKTSRKEEAQTWSLYLREEKGFKDAWVLTESLERTGDVSMHEASSRRPRYENSLSLEPLMGSYTESSLVAVTEGNYGNANAALADEAEAAWTTSDGFGFITNITNVSRFRNNASKSSAKLFTFVVEDADGKVIPSEVMLVNLEKYKKIADFKTGKNVAVKGTKPGQMITFVCDVLGYKPETRKFNLDRLSRGKDVRQNGDGIWEVRIKLRKMEVNEIGFMNKTLFFKDAAILESPSQAEMDQLVTLMRNNPAYKIILHSHCNRGPARTIKLPATADNYFDLENTTEMQGSDKRLTKKRGELVRNYLITHGIDKKRIDMIAWGSMEMIVKSTSPEAHINERMEVELVAM